MYQNSVRLGRSKIHKFLDPTWNDPKRNKSNHEMIQIQQFSKLFIEFFFDADVPWSSISFDGEAAAQPSSQGKDHQFPALWTWANGYLVDLMIIRDFLFLGFQYLDFMLDIMCIYIIHGDYKPTYEYETFPKAMPDECPGWILQSRRVTTWSEVGRFMSPTTQRM